jgi:hypothetical protein
MMRNHSSLRLVTGVLLVAVLAATMAPAAEAGSRKKHVRYKGGHHRETRVVRHSGHGHGSHGSTYIVRRSNAGPIIAGFLGGLFLGATIANAAPSGYSYYDPYCEESFASLEIYHSHFRRHRHPQVVRVIEVESGECARSYRYSDGKWRQWDDRDDRYGDDRYRDGRYRDDRDDDDRRY